MFNGMKHAYSDWWNDKNNILYDLNKSHEIYRRLTSSDILSIREKSSMFCIGFAQIVLQV